MSLSITALKKGTIFTLDNQPYRVVEYKQKVMGRGGSIVNVKIKSLIDGKVFDKTFKGNEQLDSADIVNKNVQFLYNDGRNLFFMDQDTFEQFEVPVDLIYGQEQYIKEGDNIQLQLFNNRPINLVLPKNVALTVSYSEDAVKGDTSTAITKNATLETGLVIKVPAFIKSGDIISVDTETGNYRERLNKK
jgi:elongation factor P